MMKDDVRIHFHTYDDAIWNCSMYACVCVWMDGSLKTRRPATGPGQFSQFVQ
jgi:hypothetical protein